MKKVVSVIQVGGLKVRLVREGKDEFVEFFTRVPASKEREVVRPKARRLKKRGRMRPVKTRRTKRRGK